MEEKDFITKAVDKVFEIKKETFYIIIIFIIGFVLRVLVALKKGFTADEMVHGTHTIGFISSGKLQIMDQSAVWMWLNDFFMKIFSVNMLGIRFNSILFGSLTVIVVYLIGKEVFDKKVGLIAALFSAVSSYQLRIMEAGMDTAMTFFIALSLYFFIIFTKNKNMKYFYLIWIAIGIGVMMKSIALYFIPPLLISSFYYVKMLAKTPPFKAELHLEHKRIAGFCNSLCSNFHLSESCLHPKIPNKTQGFFDHWKRDKSLKFRQYIYAGILMLIIFLPVLTFNYLLYKDKGIVDLQFAKFTKMSSDVYGELSKHLVGFRPITLFPGGIEGFKYGGLAAAALFIYKTESIVAVLFALLGLFFLFKDKNRFTFLLTLTFFIAFILLAGTTLLPNHFVWASFYVMLLTAYGVKRSINKIKNKESQSQQAAGYSLSLKLGNNCRSKLLGITSSLSNKKYLRVALYSIILLFVITSYFQTIKVDPPSLLGPKNELGEMIDFKNKNINENALVVVDSRIYRGRIAFMFWDRNYLEGTTFMQLMSNQEQIPGLVQAMDVYYIDCIPDDCGWGTVRNQPEFNKSMEDLAIVFEKNFNAAGDIKDVFGNQYFKIYYGKTQLKSSIIDIAKANKVWFYYPVNYQPVSNIFDNYETYNIVDKLLDKIAHYILYIEVFTALLLGASVFYFLIKEK